MIFRSKKKKKKNSQLHPETKKSISAILLIGISVLLVLASFKKAGPAGNLLFQSLEALFGLGYYIIPVVFLLVAILFLFTLEKNFFSTTIFGAGIFIILGMGFIDIAYPGKGGFLGKFIGLLEIPFGKTAAIVLLVTFLAIALLVTFNAPLGFKLDGFSLFKKKKAEDDLIINSNEPVGSKNEEEEKEEKEDGYEKNEEKEKKEEDSEKLIIAQPESASALKIKTVNAPKNYIPPPLKLLKSGSEKPTSGDLRANANIIKRTLESFGIAIEMGEISIGPKVTRYTLKPAEGVKLAKITTLSQDLSLALAAHPIRIEAPIPGRSLVGIEVPNKSAAIVRLGSLIAYEDFNNAGPLTFPMGRDVSGEPIFVDIEKMPHMLIAGSTGSGKSICIHTILISLLFKNSPQTLKMILIDPKRVELSVYERIPHLVAPVITEAKKTVGVFRWAINEMEERYKILLDSGSRDIKSYNKKNGEKMPYLLIVIDELADLMASYGREIEGSIVRLAQMARATGIHLLLSTQRPSVEVITGLIKANITSRVALQVASQIDSRTILDASGAEKLLGGGDLLFISSDFSKPKRIQCSYISEDEIKKVTDFIAKNNELEVDESVEEEIASGSKGDDGVKIFEEYMNSDEEDEYFDDALEIVKEAGKASASLLQRRLKIGYARAARLLDIMETKGIVGPGDGAKPREVFLE